jgi:hypothetical protein
MSVARFVPAALLAAVIGAAGSVWFMYLAGARQRSGILILMFTVWVLSPFVGLVAADHRWKDRAPPFRATLHVVTLLVALGSLAVYGEVALGPPRLKPARFFLMVPLLSWVILAIAVSIAGRISDRRPRPGAGG